MSRPPLDTLLHAAVTAVGGVERPGQVRMAATVEAALDHGDHLLVQAGTGTGKSLAYLVPALAHGERVVVATATLALQRQLIARDLPRTVEALAPLLGRRPEFAMLKGRSNYVCLHRLHDGVPEEPDLEIFAPAPASGPLAREVLRVRSWAEETETGDRDDLSPGVGDRAWAQMSVSSRECLGASRCAYGTDCFAERAREQARAADVVVTNHAILAIDALEAASILPEHDTVVVDEAHELVARVTTAATGELTPTAVGRAARRGTRLLKESESGTDVLESAAEAFTTALDALPEGRVTELPESLAWALAALRDACRAALSGLEDRDRSGEDEATRRQAVAGIEATRDVADRILAGAPDDVVWIERSDRRGSGLRVAPLGVAEVLRERLFGIRTVVLTSATLTIGGQFDAVAQSLGLDAAERLPDVLPVSEHSGDDGTPDTDADTDDGDGGEEPEGTSADDEALMAWRGIDVGSPFDYPRQGILYVARRLPAPGRDGQRPEVLDELEGLIEAAGGRTLGLFSSMRAAQSAAEAMRERLSFPVLCQGESTLGDLLAEFSSDARTCLFGTLSLWQGVDVPGSACQLVTIDRIPFPRPDDPLMSARQQATERSGGNGFMAVAASHAALLLAQGAGRLIRAAGDRGVVAILDPRIATARYGGFLRASLPDFWPTTDPAVVRRSLAAIDASAPPVAGTAPGDAAADR